MRQHHLLYDQARKKLKSSGLEERLADQKLPYGEIYASEVQQLMRETKEAGYHDQDVVPDDFEQWRKRANTLHRRKRALDWQLLTPDGIKTRGVRGEDLIALHGTYDPELFTHEEYWDHQRFGFKNHAALMSAAYARIQENRRPEDGYTWRSEHDKRTYETTVGASMHGDLRISRTDVTQYPVKEPTGLEVLVRPVTSEDRELVAAYHSDEPSLLSSVLRYVRQAGIDSDFTDKEFVEDFIAQTQKTSAYTGNFADAGYGGEHAVESAFFNYPQDLPLWQDQEPSSHALSTSHQRPYSLFVDDDAALVFAMRDNDQQLRRRLTLPAHETDQLIRGLVHQAKNGLGRTSQNQILHGLRYQFSDELQERLDEWQEFVREHS